MPARFFQIMTAFFRLAAMLAMPGDRVLQLCFGFMNAPFAPAFRKRLRRWDDRSEKSGNHQGSNHHSAFLQHVSSFGKKCNNIICLDAARADGAGVNKRIPAMADTHCA
jgi:hypothetical protein